MQAINPERPADRRETHVDALRGFALLGIVIVNSGAMASAWYGSGVSDPAFSTPLDQWVRGLVATLFETKFYLLFSFLFGYSFTLQMASAAREGADFFPRFLRRLAGLAIFGLAHAVLLFQGDILFTYSVLGAVLLSLRDWSPRAALKLALALWLLTVLVWGALAALCSLAPQVVDVAAVNAQAGAATAAYRAGPLAVIGQHLRDIQQGMALVLLLVQGPCALACFLLGFAAGQSGFLNDLAAHPLRLGRAFFRMLIPGLAGALAYVYLERQASTEPLALLALAVDLATAPFLSAAWALGLLWSFHTAAGARLAAALAPAGRHALTHYLGQSLVGALFFTGWGLGQIGLWSPLAVLLLAVAIWMLQLALSGFWVGRFAYGPAEWLLRWLTLWRIPRWRLQPGS